MPKLTNLSARAQALFREHEDALHGRTDRMFVGLMLFQWAMSLTAAFWISPRTWAGGMSQIHVHVWTALFLGGALTLFPIWLAWRQPGRALTRHVIACGQMLMSALLIHLTGGRIETHFHIFGSLALLAFYRDWRVLVTATIVVTIDHLVRGMFWPQSVYGLAEASLWRAFEHGGWVVFEVVFLIHSIRKSLWEMEQLVTRQAQLESTNELIERRVTERTQELRETEAKYRTLVEQLPAITYVAEFGRDGRWLYVSPQIETLLGFTAAEWIANPQLWIQQLQPADRDRVLAEEDRSWQTGTPFRAEYRTRTSAGRVAWFRDEAVVVRDAAGQSLYLHGVMFDITSHKQAEAEQERLHRQLLDTSRQAGMAEVATNVLHNVGNVLTSVNVSASLLTDWVSNSKASNIGKTAALLQEHRADLAEFLTRDTKGQLLPGYLTGLADQLSQERTALLEELATLTKNVDHIKDIVAMQQSYGRLSGIIEDVPASQLVEDALRMNEGALLRHEVELVREFADVPAIRVEKHKVLQILVNLIRNAKYALDEHGRTDKRLTVRVGANGQGTVKIVVLDNGVGIAPENLTRIFEHGFTTRKDGHGFGLHSAALAARELGGSLMAHSDGPGRGAQFTLELPISNESTNV